MNLGAALFEQDMAAPGTAIVEAQFGIPVGRRSGFLHKVDFALRDLETGEVGARWRCGGSSAKVSLFEEEPAADEVCSRCFVNRPNQQVVYFIEKDDLVKIGWTSDLYGRSAALGGTLLAQQPGNRQVESTLHRVFRESRVSGEWFNKSPELMSYIASLTE